MGGREEGLQLLLRTTLNTTIKVSQLYHDQTKKLYSDFKWFYKYMHPKRHNPKVTMPKYIEIKGELFPYALF